MSTNLVLGEVGEEPKTASLRFLNHEASGQGGDLPLDELKAESLRRGAARIRFLCG
jgi:hypothetical protein